MFLSGAKSLLTAVAAASMACASHIHRLLPPECPRGTDQNHHTWRGPAVRGAGRALGERSPQSTAVSAPGESLPVADSRWSEGARRRDVSGQILMKRSYRDKGRPRK